MFFNSSNVDVLLVDGSLSEARLIREVFVRFQIKNNLFHVSDCESALDYLFKKGKYEGCKYPSLILLNLNLPKMDGGELLKIIKKDKNLKIIPVIILTLSLSESELISYYRDGASAVLFKPDDYDGFEELIHSLENFWINKTKLPDFND